MRCQCLGKQTKNRFIDQLMCRLLESNSILHVIQGGKETISAVISAIFLMLLTSCSMLQAIHSNESPTPRTTGCTCSWKYTLPKKFSNDASERDDKCILGSRTGGREWLFEFTDREQKKYFYTMGPIHQGVLHYTACNISSPYHVCTTVHQLQYKVRQKTSRDNEAIQL